MTQQKHLHALIGDAIYECKKLLFQRLKGGTSYRDAAATFIAELRLALETIERDRESKT